MKRTLLAAVLWLTPFAAFADHNAPAELRKDRREQRDDVIDEWRYRHLLEELDRAQRYGDRRALLRVDQRLGFFLNEELREGRHEVRSDFREAEHTRRQFDREATWRQAAKVRDDRRDAWVEVRTLETVRRLNGEFRAVRGRLSRRALSVKRDILVQLVDLQNREQHDNRREANEDGRVAAGRRWR
jgi:hypothetical protein